MATHLVHMHTRLIERCGSTDPLADENEIVRQIRSGEATVHFVQPSGRIQYNVHLRGQSYIVVAGTEAMLYVATATNIGAQVKSRRGAKTRYLRRVKAKRRERTKRERRDESE